MKNYKFDILTNFVLFFYILSLYLFTFQENLNILSNALAGVFILCVSLRIIFITKRIYINNFLIAFFVFIVVCLISGLYAINQEIVIINVQTLTLIFIFLFFFVNYIDTNEKFLKVIDAFIYSGFIASIYIILNTDYALETRAGSELGNVNAMGLIIGISFLFGLGKIIYEKSYTKIILLLPMITVVLLTGSRKSLIFIIMCLIITYYLKNKNQLTNKIKVIFVSLFTLIISYYIVMEIPLFYRVLGVRMEGLISFITNTGTVDTSIETRSVMLSFGIEAFKERPFLGYGIDNYRVLFGLDYFTPMYSHNNFIELLVGVGIIGAFTYYLSNIIVLKKIFMVNKNKKYITLYYTLMAIIISYLFLGFSLVYFDSKHFTILLALGSVVYRLKLSDEDKTRLIK